jgi:hypothetical protein
MIPAQRRDQAAVDMNEVFVYKEAYLITFAPDGLKISGSSIELHTFFRRVVFPAFALPMMRVRKCLHLLLSSIALSM